MEGLSRSLILIAVGLFAYGAPVDCQAQAPTSKAAPSTPPPLTGSKGQPGILGAPLTTPPTMDNGRDEPLPPPRSSVKGPPSPLPDIDGKVVALKAPAL